MRTHSHNFRSTEYIKHLKEAVLLQTRVSGNAAQVNLMLRTPVIWVAPPSAYDRRRYGGYCQHRRTSRLQGRLDCAVDDSRGKRASARKAPLSTSQALKSTELPVRSSIVCLNPDGDVELVR